MKKINLYKIVGFFLVMLIFSACQHSKRPAISSSWNKVHSWSFSGKMAINDGHNSGSGKIYWEANNHSTHAEFKAPLGQGSWAITETSHNAKLKSSRNGEKTGDSALILIKNELGWEFPWNSIQYWVRGYKTNQNLHPHSSLPNNIKDNGWIITYQKWMNTSIGKLPKKIKATKGKYSVKLIIYNWDIK